MEARVIKPAMRSVMQSAVSNCFLARVAAAGPLFEDRKSSTVFLNLRRPTSYQKEKEKEKLKGRIKGIRSEENFVTFVRR